MNMIAPELDFETACNLKALKMVPNFTLPPTVVREGNPGSCYTNARLMMLSCYILKHGADALMAYDTSDRFGGTIGEAIRSANLDLIMAVNSYIEACRSTPTDIALCKTVYCDVATILLNGNASICNDAADGAFFKVIQYNKPVLNDEDYRKIINTEKKGTFKSFLIVVSGSYRGSVFVGAHETFLFYNNGIWVLFDDVDCYRKCYTGRCIF